MHNNPTFLSSLIVSYSLGFSFVPSLRWLTSSFSFVLLFFGCAHGMQKFPGQRPKLIHSSDNALTARRLDNSRSVYLFILFLGPHPLHMEVPRLGVELELQLPVYPQPQQRGTPAPLHRQILNPLSEARDRTPILMDTRWTISIEPQWDSSSGVLLLLPSLRCVPSLLPYQYDLHFPNELFVFNLFLMHCLWSNPETFGTGSNPRKQILNLGFWISN